MADDRSENEPSAAEGETTPSASTEAARELRNVLAAQRGVDLGAIEAARAAAGGREPVEHVTPPPPADNRSTRKIAAAAAVVVGLLVIGGFAMASTGSDDDTPDVLAAAPTTLPAVETTVAAPATTEVAPATTAAPPSTTEPIPTTTVAPRPPPSGQPERGAVYKDGKLILQGAVPNREVADAFVTKAAEVIGPDNVIDKYVIDPSAEVPTDGRVVVDDPVLFATGSTEISPQFHDLLDLGVIVMRLNPQVVMIVEGHTDEVGDTDRNQKLSEDRARSVVAYITARGIDPGRFDVQGKGETDPVAPNDTPEGRQQNRRIEVQLINLLSPE